MPNSNQTVKKDKHSHKCNAFRKKTVKKAGRIPENSRNSFVDLQSQKIVKKTKKNLIIKR